MTPRALPQTRRLALRPWTAEDLGHAWTLWGDPRVTARLDARLSLDRGAVREKLEREIRSQHEHGVAYWPMFDRDHRFVGCCGLHARDTRAGIWELGFHLRAEAWGRGYASEAARAVIRWSFGAFGASALFAGHHPDNQASRRVLAKLGFAFTHEEHFAPTGRDHPSYLLARPDWAAGAGAPSGLRTEGLATERLDLEPLGEGHAAELFAAVADPALYRWIPNGCPRDTADLRNRARRYVSRERWLEWVLRVRATCAVIGRIEATLEQDDRARIAYVLGVAAQGRGYAAEACREMLIALRAAGVRRAEASIDEANRPSIALATALGMRLTERIPAANPHPDGPTDETIWAVEL